MRCTFYLPLFFHFWGSLHFHFKGIVRSWVLILRLRYTIPFGEIPKILPVQYSYYYRFVSGLPAASFVNTRRLLPTCGSRAPKEGVLDVEFRVLFI